MTTWKEIQCHGCDGHGQVSDYGLGDDFYGAKECDTCNGSGRLFVTDKGTMAQWPGGPLVGRLTKAEMAQGC